MISSFSRAIEAYQYRKAMREVRRWMDPKGRLTDHQIIEGCARACQVAGSSGMSSSEALAGINRLFAAMRTNAK